MLFDSRLGGQREFPSLGLFGKENTLYTLFPYFRVLKRPVLSMMMITKSSASQELEFTSLLSFDPFHTALLVASSVRAHCECSAALRPGGDRHFVTSRRRS